MTPPEATPADAVLDEAVAALRDRGVPLAQARLTTPDAPGLYAVHAGPAAQRLLGVTELPPAPALYVGKAERSLLSRDVRTHFSTGRTGTSTLRRSLAALLHGPLSLVPVPRRPGDARSFALDPGSDARLTDWMLRELTLAVWPAPAGIRLADVERAILRQWSPPLNLTHVKRPWPLLRERRRELRDQALSRTPRPAAVRASLIRS